MPKRDDIKTILVIGSVLLLLDKLQNLTMPEHKRVLL